MDHALISYYYYFQLRSRKFTEHYDNPNEIYTRTTARDSYYSEFEEHPDGSINGVPAVDLGVPLNENGVGMTEGWKRIQEPDNLEESQRTLVNPEALYANTTFIGEVYSTYHRSRNPGLFQL